MLIDYLDAENGGINFYGDAGDAITVKVGYGTTVAECQQIISENGLADNVMGSSSMDFASEYGFAEDGDALSMYYEAIKNCKPENWKAVNSGE